MTMYRIIPVVDRDDTIVLYDIYVDNEWHGSRRLLRDAKEYARGHYSRTTHPSRLEPRDPGELLAEGSGSSGEALQGYSRRHRSVVCRLCRGDREARYRLHAHAVRRARRLGRAATVSGAGPEFGTAFVRA